jgi:hypothetical protein
MVGFGHKLRWTQQPDGKWAAQCSCGKWAGIGKTKEYVRSKWDEKHIEPKNRK